MTKSTAFDGSRVQYGTTHYAVVLLRTVSVLLMIFFDAIL